MNACFFDMDGTLIDSRADLAATVNHAREDLGLAALPEVEVLAHVGQGAKYLLEHAIPECAGNLAEANACFMGRYAEHCCDRVALYPGVMRTLEALASRGWHLGVVTNKPAFATRRILEHLGIRGLFGNAVVAGGDCAELKPSAAPLVECASRISHPVSHDDWMVGDAWTDMACAAAAGVKGAFCAFGFGHLREEGYTVRLERMDDLLACIQPCASARRA